MKKHYSGNPMAKRFGISDAFLVVVLSFLFVTFVVPFIHVFMLSLSDPNYTRPGLVLWPNRATLDAYSTALSLSTIIDAMKISGLRVVIGTLSILAVNMLAAYMTIQEDLPGVKMLRRFFLVPMYLIAGLIPNYYLITGWG